MLFERGTLIKILKRHITELPERLFLNKEVASIDSGKDNVEVHCTDGSSYTASMRIEADGINGTALSFVEKSSTGLYEKDYTTTFYGVYGHGGSLSSDFGYSVDYKTYSKGFSSQLIVPLTERYFFLIY